MEILNSAWLIKMLQKSGSTPQLRMLSIFDILSDWVEAPQIRETFDSKNLSNSTSVVLLDYLTEEAKSCGAHDPEALAQQLYFIALSALKESLRSPDSNHFIHAKQAAEALTAAQTEKTHFKNKPASYGLATGLFVIVGVGSFLLLNALVQPAAAIKDAAVQPFKQANPIAGNASSPADTATMYASIEQMRQGQCHYLEVLQIPDKHKKVYLENVVGGEVPSNPEDLAIAKNYLQKVQCNYTPMLMKNSTS